MKYQRVTHLARWYDRGVSGRMACGKLLDTVKGKTNLLWTTRTKETTCVKCRGTVAYSARLLEENK